MARYGFSYDAPVEDGGGAGVSALRGHDRRYGLADPDRAASFGYSLADLIQIGDGNSTGVEEDNPGDQDANNSELTPYDIAVAGEPGDPVLYSLAEMEALPDWDLIQAGERIPPGGCGRETYLRVYAPTDDAVDVTFVDGLQSESFARSREDSRVQEVFDDWSACMSNAGYAGLNDAGLGASEQFMADPDSEAAKAAAVQDVACKREVNVVGVWFAVESAYQQQLIEENAELLELARSQRETQLEYAAELIGS